MYICQWSLEIVFGKQKQALDIMKEWGAEKFRSFPVLPIKKQSICGAYRRVAFIGH
jgi:hypothetical protein